MYSLKHEQRQCFIGFKTQGDSREFYRPDKTRTMSVLNGFKNEPFYEFIGEVILEINLI